MNWKSPGGRRRAMAVAAVGVLTVAVAYEAAVAAGWVTVGPEPGEAPPENGLVIGAALVALVGAAIVCGLRSARGPACADVLYVLLAPAAAAFVIARFYTYDPYYAPTLRRMSEDGALPAWWIYGLAALAIVAGVATAIRPRIGLAATAIVLLLSALTALAEGSGH